MPFFEDRILTDSIEIKTTSEKLFNVLTSIVDDAAIGHGIKKIMSVSDG